MANTIISRLPILFSGALVLSACASLPTSGPTASQVLDEERDAAAAIGYRYVDVAAGTIPPPPEGQSGRLSALPAAGPVNGSIGPGDMLDITLYEVGSALFSGPPAVGGSAFDPSARSRVLSGIEVQPTGDIDLPFAGRVNVAGLSRAEAAARIERAYRGLSQQPQAQVAVTRDLNNMVVFSGAIGRQGRFSLSPKPETLSEAIALSGGPSAPPQDIQLRVSRGGESIELPLAALISGSDDDIALQPGDRIELIPSRRSVTAFGAMNSVREIPFETRRLTLAEAIARAGGPAENLADPSAVFVFRDTPDQPTIYRVDLLRPSGYFLAQRFQMQDKDLIYVANSAANQPTKLVDIVNRLFTPVFTVREITR